jgi:hypothetical protein
MRNLLVSFLLVLCSILFISSAHAGIIETPATSIDFIGVSSFGGSYAAERVQMDPIHRADVVAALGPPIVSYGYSELYSNGDQFYIVYYDVSQNTRTVVILPVTSW